MGGIPESRVISRTGTRLRRSYCSVKSKAPVAQLEGKQLESKQLESKQLEGKTGVPPLRFFELGV